jgi:alkylation response protein AidB-like acyl-CoA dehydrogenase
MDLAVLFEEMGRACAPSPLHSSAVLCGLTILEAGNEEQKEKLLPAIASGSNIFALAFTEADYGWSAGSVQLAARRQNGSFILNGTKVLVPDAQAADSLVVAARTDDQPTSGAGLTLLLVDRNTPGLAIRNVSSWSADYLNEITFDNVHVSTANVLGEVNEGWRYLEPVLETATAVLCAYMVGGCQQMCDISVDFSRSRIAFGVPISTFQRVQDMIIEIVNNLDAARWTTYESLWKLEENHPKHKTQEAISLAKAVSSDGFTRAVEGANQVHGGVSVDKSYGLYLYNKRARTLFSYLGTPDWHRKRLSSLLGL